MKSMRQHLRSQPASSKMSDSTISKSDDASSLTDTMVMVDLFGQEPSVKTFFKDPVLQTWSVMRPGEEIFNASDDEKHALIVRHETNVDRTKVSLASIKVQSPHLKEMLGKIFNGFMGISTELRDVEFKAPFHEFCYKWEDVRGAIAELKDDAAIQHAKLLQPIIAAEIAPKLERMNDLMDHGLVSNDYLWSIFEPGQDLFTKADGQDQMFRIKSHSRSDKGFHIQCEYIDTDGASFGFSAKEFIIPKFQSLKTIASLPQIPANHCPGIEDIRARLTARGARFRDLIGIHHVSYAGSYLPVARKSKRKQTMNHGRVMIDNESCIANGSGIKQPRLEPKLEALDPQRLSDSVAKLDLNAGTAFPPITSDDDFDAKSTLTDDLFVYCSPTVRGYCLTTRQWAIFDIDRIQDVQWTQDAFQRLVLSPDWKEILLSFVVTQMSQPKDESFDDIVKGKGKGMIMLLAGAPGIGKTLTAESVAEEMRLPLYSMSMGQLGSDAVDVEKNLKTHSELSTRWKAVMLLDECDVFLAKRTATDMERSKLVSVFLRTLEYFQGTMFLTTNRADEIDPAFESRIHLTFNYPELDHDARLRVWRNFVGPASAASGNGDEENDSCVSNLTNYDLNMLAGLDLNGRVIKNVVKTARLLAIRKGAPLTIGDVQTVLRVKGVELPDAQRRMRVERFIRGRLVVDQVDVDDEEHCR